MEYYFKAAVSQAHTSYESIFGGVQIKQYKQQDKFSFDVC